RHTGKRGLSATGKPTSKSSCRSRGLRNAVNQFATKLSGKLSLPITTTYKLSQVKERISGTSRCFFELSDATNSTIGSYQIDYVNFRPNRATEWDSTPKKCSLACPFASREGPTSSRAGRPASSRS